MAPVKSKGNAGRVKLGRGFEKRIGLGPALKILR